MEVKEAAHAVQLHPDDHFIPMQQLRALVAAGRIEEAEQKTVALSAARAQRRPVEPYIVLSNELAAHGHRAATGRAVQRALALLDETPSRHLGDRATLLLADRQWQQAAQLTQRVMQADSSLSARGMRGVAAAAVGDTAAARAMMEALTGVPQPHSNGMAGYWRAAIAAHLGDRATAVQLLQQAMREGLTHDLRMHSSPMLAPLRAYAPYRALISQPQP